MPRSKAENKKYLREWREKEQKEKRFNKPFRVYMQVKYRDEYNEFCHFFNTLNENHPTAGDLTKTTTFKKWKSQQLNCEESDMETSETTEATGPEAEIPSHKHIELRSEHVELRSEQENDDEVSVPVQEIQPLLNMDIDQVDGRIQQIIDELEQDNVLRGLLNEDQIVQDNDEGIHLDVEIELNDIIDPFDYEVEVEGGLELDF